MSEYQDVEQIRDRQGYIIAFQALDVVTGEPVLLKAKNGALQVDLCELEDVRITIQEGTKLPVEFSEAQGVTIENVDPIPVSLPEGSVDVEIQNTDPIPVMFAATPDVAIPDGVEVTNFPSSFQVSNFPSAVTDDVIAVAPVVGEKTITGTAAALFAGASPLASRQLMRVRNLSLGQQILVGPSTVAGNGFPVEPGGEVLLKFNKEVPVAVYAISSGAAAKARVMEA